LVKRTGWCRKELRTDESDDPTDNAKFPSGDGLDEASMTRFLRGAAVTTLGVCGLICLPVGTRGQTITKTLIVGTEVTPPFVMKREDGSWEGISIDLWRQIADRLHLRYEFRELTLGAMLGAVASNQLDAAVAAITITADRERNVEFTHSYYTSGLAIGVRRASQKISLLGTLQGFLTGELLQVVLALFLVVIAAGASVWWFERKVNRAEFGGRWWQGLGSGLWWSVAAVTTTGYGDKTPKTFAGRLVAVLWMFAGLVIISSFIAAVTASLTVRRFSGWIRGFEDLPHHRVAVIAGTTSETYLQERHIPAVRYVSSPAALQAVVDGSVDAFVYDTPLLLYRANQMRDAVIVLPQTFDRQGYGIALPPHSPLYKSIDVALLETITDPVWQQIQARYLSPSER